MTIFRQNTSAYSLSPDETTQLLDLLIEHIGKKIIRKSICMHGQPPKDSIELHGYYEEVPTEEEV